MRASKERTEGWPDLRPHHLGPYTLGFRKRNCPPTADRIAIAAKAGAEPKTGNAKMNAMAPSIAPLTTVQFSNRRLAREWKTVAAMVHIYCRGRHGDFLCEECQGLMRYISLRLERCRFGADKPTCAKCPVHCYQRD